MPLRTLLRYRNPDLTTDVNHRLRDLVQKGVFSGGLVLPVAGQLRVAVQPFAAVGADGMVTILEGAPEQIAVTAGVTQYVLLRAVYVVNGPPTAEIEVLTTAAYGALTTAEQDERIILALVSLGGGASEVAVSDISFVPAESVDPVARGLVRGTVATKTALPDFTEPATGVTTQNKDFDIYLVQDEKVFYAWDTSGVTDQWLPLVSTATELELQQHRLNQDDGTGSFEAQHMLLKHRQSLDEGTASVKLHAGDGTDYGTGNAFVDEAFPWIVWKRQAFGGLINATSVQLTGKVFVGTGAVTTAEQYIRLTTSGEDKQLIDNDREVLTVLAVFDPTDAFQITPSVDADALGFIENPVIRIDFTQSLLTQYTGNLDVVFGAQESLGNATPAEIFADRMFGFIRPAEDIPVVGRFFTRLPTNIDDVQEALEWIDTPDFLHWDNGTGSIVGVLGGPDATDVRLTTIAGADFTFYAGTRAVLFYDYSADDLDLGVLTRFLEDVHMEDPNSPGNEGLIFQAWRTTTASSSLSLAVVPEEALLLGAGEGSRNLYDAITDPDANNIVPSGEHLHLAADNAIYLWTGTQTAAATDLKYLIDAGGDILPQQSGQDLGSVSLGMRHIYTEGGTHSDSLTLGQDAILAGVRHETTGGRSGVVVVNDDSSLNPVNEQAAFLAHIPHDSLTTTNDTWRAFGLRRGDTSTDWRYWVDHDGSGYFSGTLAIGTESTAADLLVHAVGAATDVTFTADDDHPVNFDITTTGAGTADINLAWTSVDGVDWDITGGNALDLDWTTTAGFFNLFCKGGTSAALTLESTSPNDATLSLQEDSDNGLRITWDASANEALLQGDSTGLTTVAKWTGLATAFLAGQDNVTTLGGVSDHWESLYLQDKTSVSSGQHAGRLYFLSGRPRTGDGTGANRVVQQTHSLTSDIVFSNVSTTDQSTLYVIPANTLTVGSVIRIRVSGFLDDIDTATDPEVRIIYPIGGSVISQATNATSAVSGNKFILEAVITYEAVGATGTIRYSGQGTWAGVSLGSPLLDQSQSVSTPAGSATFRTDVNRGIEFEVTRGSGNIGQLEVWEAIIDIT